MQENIFPRELTRLEKELLFSILPPDKPGYNSYREKIDLLTVIGYGRFGGTNLILGKKRTTPDLSAPSAPVFALGTVVYKNNSADIIIHEEIYDEIEFDISFKEKPDGINLVELNRWSYSDWNPGDKAPDDNSNVREVEIVDNKFILAFSPSHKKIWLHDYESKVNLLIPITNFYNYLMIVKNIRSADLVFKPNLLFANLNDYKDEELQKAFIAYNNYFKRIKIDFVPAQTGQKIKKSIFSFFKRGKN